MENSKGVSIAVMLVIGIGILVAIGLFAQTPSAPTGEQPTGETPHGAMVPYTSDEFVIAFEYPANYTLQTHEQGTDERTWNTIVLIDSEMLQSAMDNGASEGPPGIAVQIFDNVEAYTAEEWIKGMSYSNYKLSTDGVLANTTVGGEPALAYRYSGLFENDAAVVAHGNNIYMFTADWLTAEDATRRDLGRVLESVTFK